MNIVIVIVMILIIITVIILLILRELFKAEKEFEEYQREWER